MSALFFILKILGGLGIFLFGMRVMSDAIRTVSGSPLRRFLGRLTESTSMGALTGSLITMILQSSSAVTVTLISLVNAGMITVRESVGVLLGTNVGTTITAWLVVLSLGGLSLGDLALPIIGLSLPFFLIDNKQARQGINIVIGFSLLFVGLGVLKDQFGAVNASSLFEGAAAMEAGSTIVSNLVFLLIGVAFTALIQSSSAATTATLAAVMSGLLSLENGAAMVLGENIGTTITANLAAAVGNRDARRTARIHFLFNAVGALVWIWFIPVVVDLLSGVFAGMQAQNRPGVVIAAFHTSFNLINALIASLFVTRLTRVSEWMVFARNESDERPREVETLPVDTLPADLAIDKVQRELLRSANIARRMNDATLDLLMSVDEVEKLDLLAQIENWEGQTDRIHSRVNIALDKLVQKELSPELGERIRACTTSSQELERIGDIYRFLSRKLDDRERGHIYFIPKQRERLYKMFKLLNKACTLTEFHLQGRGQGDFEAIADVEKSINEYRDVLREKHLKDSNAGRYPVASGLLFHELVTGLEDIGDRLAQVSGMFGRLQKNQQQKPTRSPSAPAAAEDATDPTP